MTGQITSINTSWGTKKPILSLEINELEELKRKYDKLINYPKLNIEIKPYREKRSLDANAYSWVLMSKIAAVVGSSKEEVYEEMLQKYGYFYEDETGYITVTVKTIVDMSKIDGHWKRYKGNGKFVSYLMIKGSSEYNTAEMSRFIECIIGEAKELDIETLPPDEIERMKQSWQKA